MIELLAIEWLKVRKYRTFWVLTGLFVICFPALTWLGYYFQTQIPRQGQILLNAIQYFQFPDVWQTAAYLGSFLLVLPGLLIITLTTNEFVFKTRRQNIIDGWSRMQFILSKWLVVVIFALIAVGCLVITAFIFGLSTGNRIYSADIFYNADEILFFFIQSLAYLSVAFLFGMLFRRAGLAIGLFFLYAWIIEKILSFMLNHFFGNIGRFLPLESTNHLIPNPLFRKLPGFLSDDTSPYAYLAVAVVYILLIVFITIRQMKRSDL